MFFPLTSRQRELAIRVTGLAMLPIGALAVEGLYRRVHITPLHSATALEFGLAAAGFLLLSIGSALLALGGQIFDEVEVSSRWATQSPLQRHKLPMGLKD
jgi:hypothetical protein